MSPLHINMTGGVGCAWRPLSEELQEPLKFYIPLPYDASYRSLTNIVSSFPLVPFSEIDRQDSAVTSSRRCSMLCLGEKRVTVMHQITREFSLIGKMVLDACTNTGPAQELAY